MAAYMVKHMLTPVQLEREAVWKRMEKREVCGTRTWCSMRTHWMHVMVHDLKTFQLNPPQNKMLDSEKNTMEITEVENNIDNQQVCQCAPSP